ncbi:MAG: RluA family pseudouridine synthase [Clostridia bacterium]|nr:RluA family pseudouridine synthase [Clostridia bacterium]
MKIEVSSALSQRLDLFVTEQLSELSRSYVQKLLTDQLILVNGQASRANYKVKAGDCIEVKLPPPQELEALPENIPLDIYYEDQDLLVINKPRGMVVHPAEGNFSGTLVNALLYHCQDLSGINGVLRPGIVHRLDKDTSGLLMVAKNDLAHQALAEQLNQRTVVRRYFALVHGHLKHKRGIIDAPLARDPFNRQKIAVVYDGGRQAITHYRVLASYARHSYLSLRLETGRTHQIRVHLQYIGHPVLGDPKYSSNQGALAAKLNGQFLHAGVLGFVHPRTGQEMHFEAPLPSLLQEGLEEAQKL